MHGETVKFIVNLVGKPGILVTTASKHMMQEGYSKCGLCINIFYRNLGKFTAQSKNCHLMKPSSHDGIILSSGCSIQRK
jgi:hypothetical protein